MPEKVINELKKRLPNVFGEKMKNLINPVFLPRNEEEIIKFSNSVMSKYLEL